MLFANEDQGVATWLLGGITGGGMVALALGLVKAWKLYRSAESDANKNAHKLTKDQQEWINEQKNDIVAQLKADKKSSDDKFQKQLDKVTATMDVLQQEHASCRAENAVMRFQMTTQAAEIAVLKQENVDQASEIETLRIKVSELEAA